MTTQQPQGGNHQQQAQPQQAQQQQPNEVSGDELRRLVEIDIPRDRHRLKQINDPSPERVLTELNGTVMEYMAETGKNLVNVRDWAHHNFQQMAVSFGDRLEELEARIDTIQTYGAETAITPEDAEILNKVITACNTLAQTLLQGPFPIQARDAEGQQKLGEVLLLAQQAEKIVVEATLSEDYDEDDEEEDAGEN